MCVQKGQQRGRILLPGLAEHGLALKTVGDAMHIRNTVLRRVARIELESDPAVRRRLGHFVVIGGGFSGVETAGELVDCLRKVAGGDTWLDPQGTRWVMEAYRNQNNRPAGARPQRSATRLARAA